MRSSLMLALLLASTDVFRKVIGKENIALAAEDPILNDVCHAAEPALLTSINAPREVIFLHGPGGSQYDSHYVTRVKRTVARHTNIALSIGDGSNNLKQEEVISAIKRFSPSANTKYTVIIEGHGYEIKYGDMSTGVHGILVGFPIIRQGRIVKREVILNTCDLIKLFKQKIPDAEFFLLPCKSGLIRTCALSVGDKSNVIVALESRGSNLLSTEAEALYHGLDAMPPRYILSARNLLLAWSLANVVDYARTPMLINGRYVIDLDDVYNSFKMKPINEYEKHIIRDVLAQLPGISIERLEKNIAHLQNPSSISFVWDPVKQILTTDRSNSSDQNTVDDLVWAIALLLEQRVITAAYYGQRSPYLDGLTQHVTRLNNNTRPRP